MTAYEHKRANEGDPVSHAHAKQALAALAGFEVGESRDDGFMQHTYAGEAF